MIALGFVWLVLMIIELTAGLSPFLERLGYVIWALFVADFLLEFALAPDKSSYLRGNWLTVLALAVPALRVLAVFRFLRVVRAARGLRLLRVVSSVNRGMGSLGRVMGRHGFGYVVSLTALVIVGEAAGIYAFERNVPGTAATDFGSALWWTAMVITTMDSDYFPRSPEGRLLCLLLATYGFAIFGDVTATIASVFIAATPSQARASSPGHASWRCCGRRSSRCGASSGRSPRGSVPPADTHTMPRADSRLSRTSAWRSA